MPIKIGKPDEQLNVSYWLWFRPGFNGVDFFFFHTYFLARYNVAQKVNFFLMKMTLFQISKQVVFLEFSNDPLNSFNVTPAGVFSVNQNVIEVYNDENIKFF